MRCSIVGGYAVALHGVVRGTVDLDIVIEHTAKQFQLCEEALQSLGFVSRLPITAKDVFHFKDEYIKNRNLLAWSFYHPGNPMDVVDIVIVKDLRTLKSVRVKALSYNIPVISLNDLVNMKREAGRIQDIEDLKLLEPLLNAKK